MSFFDLSICWIAMAVATIINGVWRDEKLTPSLLGVAFLAATATTSIAALYPLTKLPSLWGVGVSWAHHFLMFNVFTAVFLRYSLRGSIVSGLGYATLLTIYALLR